MAPKEQDTEIEYPQFLEPEIKKPVIIPPKPTQGGANGSIHLNLGTFNATKIPMIIASFGCLMCYLSTYSYQTHPVTEDLFLIKDGLFPMMFITLFYILFSIVWGPRLMENREPFKLKKVIMAYNVFQVVFCVYMFNEMGQAGWFGKYSLYCEPVKYSTEPDEVRMASVAYWYYISKILDFADTLFFILTKKWAHVSVLHIVHHSNMHIALWFGVKHTPRGQITFLGFLNSFVHVVMYSYYFLAALGPKVRPYLWWKKYLTSVQLIQFVAVFLHSTCALWNGCEINKGMTCMTLFYSSVFFVLFMDFYLKAYRPSKKSSTPNSSTSQIQIPATQILQRTNVTKNLQTMSQTIQTQTSLISATCNLRERQPIVMMAEG